MLARLLGGTVKGLLIGAVAAFAGLRLLGTGAGGALEYALALGTGLLVGLVAGKPIWARDAKLEAGLKAAAGALLSVGLLFALRRFTHLELDLTQFGLGKGAAAELPAVALPAVGVALGLLFELDDAAGQTKPRRDTRATSSRAPRSAPPAGSAAELEADELERDEQPGASERSLRKH